MKSILLHLGGGPRAGWVIDLAVRIARRHIARLRALTIADTARMESFASNGESALHTVAEQTRLHRVRTSQDAEQAEFTRACLAGGIDFDVRRLSGNTRELLLGEALLHDLMIAPYLPHEPGDDSGYPNPPGELVGLLRNSPTPVLIPRRAPQDAQRVLLVYDGTLESSRLIRSFVRTPLFERANHRLLAVGRTDDEAKHSLRAVADYCRAARFEAELGWAAGSLKTVVLPYVCKWEADLVALGAARGNHFLRRLQGDIAQDVLSQTACGLYLAG